jgi:hypothetical protein
MHRPGKFMYMSAPQVALESIQNDNGGLNGCMVHCALRIDLQEHNSALALLFSFQQRDCPKLVDSHYVENRRPTDTAGAQTESDLGTHARTHSFVRTHSYFAFKHCVTSPSYQAPVFQHQPEWFAIDIELEWT